MHLPCYRSRAAARRQLPRIVTFKWLCKIERFLGERGRTGRESKSLERESCLGRYV